MLSVCTWLWKQDGYRKRFCARHVNVLRNMVERNLSLPHEFVCLTDMPEGIDPRVRILPLPSVPHVTWSQSRPNCFKRLWAFSPQAKEAIGERIASFDLDVAITGSLDPLFSRTEDFVIWKDAIIPNQYNGSFWLLTAGSRTRVWSEFKGDASVQKARGKRGSDQGWLSHILPNEATWTEKHGVLSYRKHVQRKGLPESARVVFFHGKPDPWEAKDRWISQHYR